MEESVRHQAIDGDLTVPGVEKDWPEAHGISHSDKKTGTLFTINDINAFISMISCRLETKPGTIIHQSNPRLQENLLNMLAADGKDDASMSSPSATAKTLAGPSQYNTAPALPSTAFPSKPVSNQDAGLFMHTSGKSSMVPLNPGNKQMVLTSQGYNGFKQNHLVLLQSNISSTSDSSMSTGGPCLSTGTTTFTLDNSRHYNQVPGPNPFPVRDSALTSPGNVSLEPNTAKSKEEDHRDVVSLENLLCQSPECGESPHIQIHSEESRNLYWKETLKPATSLITPITSFMDSHQFPR